jgi:uncharacterized protein YqjF (DUF2071 family)
VEQAGTIVRPFLTAEWRDLVMLNFEVDPDLVEPLVPAGTELDRFLGRCLVSLVGFRFVDVRLRGRRVPFHTDFDEVNLRFYVRRRAGDELRRAVVFVRELVPLPAVALVARWVYGERYSALPMRHDVGPGRVAYEWRLAGRWQGLAVEPVGRGVLPEPGSEEEFVTEHYWGYARRGRGTVEYHVTHPRWPVRRARLLDLTCDARRLYGAGFAGALARPPTSAFVAEGSEIAVGPRQLLR